MIIGYCQKRLAPNPAKITYTRQWQGRYFCGFHQSFWFGCHAMAYANRNDYEKKKTSCMPYYAMKNSAVKEKNPKKAKHTNIYRGSYSTNRHCTSMVKCMQSRLNTIYRTKWKWYTMMEVHKQNKTKPKHQKSPFLGYQTNATQISP